MNKAKELYRFVGSLTAATHPAIVGTNERAFESQIAEASSHLPGDDYRPGVTGSMAMHSRQPAHHVKTPCSLGSVSFVQALGLLLCLLIAYEFPFSRSRAGAAHSFSATPLNDLGQNTYLGFQGGLYENGTNTVPSDQNSAGLARSAAIKPLDGTGNVDTTHGKIVLLSIGMSNASDEWCGVAGNCSRPVSPSFMSKEAGNTLVNHTTLVIVNGAQGGQDATAWASPISPDYNMVRDTRLAPLGLTEKQVQAIWLKEADANPTRSFSSGSSADAYTLERNLGNVVRACKVRYPKLQEVFLSSRIYGGYATTSLNPEPYAYESGFSVKWLIQAQIDQMRNSGTIVDTVAGDLNYNTVAPWIVWGPYLWADGTVPRSDGLTWVRSDFQSDGTHPSSSGIRKVDYLLENFFLSSPYTKCWYTAAGCP